MLCYVPNHSKTAKLQKYNELLSKYRSNYAKLQKWSNYDELHRFDIDLTLKHQTTQVTSQTMNCIKCQNDQKCWVTSQTIRNTAKLQKCQITMNCIDLTLKRSKTFSYVPNKLRNCNVKPTKVIKLQWIESIWRPNHSNNAKLQKWSNYDEVHGFDVKTIKNVELRPKPFKTQQNYKSNQITMNCIDLTSKR